MDRQRVEHTVRSVLTVVLKEPLNGADVTRQNTASWDSLKHIEIMFALEDELETQFLEEELAALDSVKKIVDAVLSKHAA
ncbi:MAG TPA: acyl carrier protein [Nitrospira sp.]|nr:acyl carrier protein [Nitrospira sp.]